MRLSRRAVALVAGVVLALPGGALADSAARAPAPADSAASVVGEVHFANASVTDTCNSSGAVIRTQLSVDYDAQALTTSLTALASHSTVNPRFVTEGSATPMDDPDAVVAGRSGTLTQTENYASPSTGYYDVFAVVIRTAAQPSLNHVAVRISAPHDCGAGRTTAVTHELAGPTAAVSGPTCAGSVTVAVDNPTDLTWTPRVTVSGADAIVGAPLAPRTHGVVQVDVANARSATLGVSFRTSSPETGWDREDTDGGLYGRSLPTDGSCTPSARGAFAPVTPTRLVDTRAGTGAPRVPVAAGGHLVVQVSGHAGIPTGAEAALVNLTAIGQRGGYLQAWSATDGPGTGSVLNFAAAQPVANTTIVPLDIHGRFSVRNGSPGPTTLIVDVTGYVLGGPGASGPGDFVAQDPERLYDSATAGSRVPVAAGATLRVPVAGRHGVPSSAGTLAARVAVASPTRSGFVNVWTGTGTEPATSTLPVQAGRTGGSLAVVPIAADGTVAITNHSSGTVRVVVDTEGWWRAGAGATGSIVDLRAARLLDTRRDPAPDTGTSAPIAARTARTLNVLHVPAGAGTAGLHGVTAVVLNVTVTGATAPGYLTVRPTADTGLPTTSSVNFPAGVNAANAVIAPVGDDGTVALYNGSTAGVHVVVDIAGYVTR